LPEEGFLQVGDNVVELSFEGEYVSDCEGMQKFLDSTEKTAENEGQED
jgi:aminopeptidase N